MIIIGLTGGIASGKSTVSNIFKRLGAYIIDADLLARDAVKPMRPAWSEIVKNFGKGMLNKNGSINRRRLGEIVFGNKKKRRLLNSIVHPRVFERADEIKKRIIKKDPDAIIIFDAALLIETGAYKKMDKVAVVYANEGLQIKRLMKRDGLTEDEAIKRIKAQMPLKDKVRFADYIIDGSRAIPEVRGQVKEILVDIKGGKGIGRVR
ncbi:MAG: dephospho-CoA kinase [Nitrospirae bacterium]|nr:dephospho-CoA kinase [Nitrospirota bacterium]